MLFPILYLSLALNTVQAFGLAGRMTPAYHSVGRSLPLGMVPRAGFPADNLEPRQSSECPSGSVVCGIYCIPTSYSCCTGGQGGCAPGSYCVDGGCCPTGETCSGAPVGCAADETNCGIDCVPTTGTCCPDQTGCLVNSYCYLTTSGGYSCCNTGQTCSDAAAGGSTGVSISAGTTPTATSASQIASISGVGIPSLSNPGTGVSFGTEPATSGSTVAPFESASTSSTTHTSASHSSIVESTPTTRTSTSTRITSTSTAASAATPPSGQNSQSSEQPRAGVWALFASILSVMLLPIMFL